MWGFNTRKHHKVEEIYMPQPEDSHYLSILKEQISFWYDELNASHTSYYTQHIYNKIGYYKMEVLEELEASRKNTDTDGGEG